jgi:hypothetical protein
MFYSMLFKYLQSITLQYNKVHSHLLTHYVIQSSADRKYQSCSNMIYNVNNLEHNIFKDRKYTNTLFSDIHKYAYVSTDKNFDFYYSQVFKAK